MQIASIQHLTVIDYPGKLACVLFTFGCNFRCWYCHNHWLIKPHNGISCLDKGTVMNFLEERRQWLDGVVISGGEPTIHKNLPDFFREVKSMGYSVKLDTNGSNPQMLNFLVANNLVDFLAMDIKTVPVEGEYSKVIGVPDNAVVSNIRESICIIKESGVKYQFRTTWLPGIHDINKIDLIQLDFLGEGKLKINTFITENGILANQINEY